MNNPNGVCLWHGHCTHTHTGDRHGRRSRPGMMPLALTSRFGLMGGALAGIVLSGAAAGQTPTPQCLNDEQIMPNDVEPGDYFGSGIGIDGNFAIVGAVLKDHDDPPAGQAGAAYIYECDGDTWDQVEKLELDDPQTGDRFGSGADVSGDVAVVAASGWPGGAQVGRVDVFRRDSGEPFGQQWEVEATLIASDAMAGDSFGGQVAANEGVAIDTNLIVAGASRAAVNNQADAGKAYIFRFDGQDWIEEAILTAGSYAQELAEFGYSVAISGRRVVVGAPFENHSGEGDAGAAYVFARDNTTGTWDLEARITAAQPEALDLFGRSVSIDGATAVVGAPTQGGTGFATIFVRENGQWTEITTFFGGAGDEYGYSVAVSGSLFVVGARNHGDHPEVSGTVGAAFLYQRQPNGSSGTWVEALELYSAPPFAEPSDRFGEVVAIDGDRAIIGALGDQPDGFGQGGQHGAIYPFPGLPGCAFD